MPITQSRMISILNGTNRLYKKLEQIEQVIEEMERIKLNPPEGISIEDLMDAIQISNNKIESIISDLRGISHINLEDFRIFMEEVSWFKKVKNRNEKHRNKQMAKRIMRRDEVFEMGEAE